MTVKEMRPVLVSSCTGFSFCRVTNDMEKLMWNYIVTHWRGRFGLLKSSLLNGVGGYFLLLGLVFVIIESGGAQNPFLIYAGTGWFLLWGIWAGVGIIRCGARNIFDRANTKIRRIGGAVAIAGVMVVAWFTAEDVYYLFLK